MNDLDAVNVSKRYWIPPTVAQSRRPVGPWQRLWSKVQAPRVPFWALRDVSFSVERGEALGIIGPNGAGKSTLLKLFSEITAPTAGEIRLYGRLAALIEVGSGFHQELTGRENVFLSGSILGMRRAEIVDKLDQIVDFAGVGDFIDAPVKWYSSGMYVRLGFAVAAHLDAQILLVDEVLAVGDAAFQQKCYERIKAMRAAGRTIVFISHDLWSVERLCDRAILMDRGRVALDGPASDVVSHYRRAAAATPASAAESAGGPIAIAGAAFTGSFGSTSIRTGFPLTVCVSFDSAGSLPDVAVEVQFRSQDGSVLHCAFSTALSAPPLNLDRGFGEIVFESSEVGLQPGIYSVVVRIVTRAGELVQEAAAGTLVVEAGKSVRGTFFMPHQWRLVGQGVVGAAATPLVRARRP